MASLRQLLELRVAAPADLSDDGAHALVTADLTGTMQLYRVARAGGELERLTDLPEPVSGVFVPGSRRILVSMDEGGNERHQLHLMEARPGATLEPLVVEPEFMHLSPCTSWDGHLLAYTCNRRNGVDFDVYVRLLADPGAERTLLELGGMCEAAGFSPDARWLAVLRLTEKSGDNDLHLVDVETREHVFASPHDDEAVFGAPVWRPDSRSFLFATSTGRDTAAIARYDLASRSFKLVLEDEWDLRCEGDRAGRHLLVEANVDGYSRLELRDPETLALRSKVPLPGRGVVEPMVFSADGRFLAYGFTSAREPGDVWLYDTDTGETTRLTHASEPPAGLPEPELARFRSFDGESIPVFLTLPDGDGAAPVVVIVHGGPEGQARPIFNPFAPYFVDEGYAVAVPNVRGSTGYGKRYEHLDDVQKRLDAVRDLAALHGWLESTGRVDPRRVVLMGGSYGGYMVLAGLAFHPERFAAGVDIVGISSLVTFLENTSPWRRAFREREYGSLERDRELLAEVSPISHVDRIRAPLFIIHGRNDPRVPLSEAEQLYRALRERGVPAELLVYDDEGHGLSKLANRLDAYPRAVAFLERVLAG